MQTNIEAHSFNPTEGGPTLPIWKEALVRACKNLRVEPTREALTVYTGSSAESIIPESFVVGLLDFLEEYPLQSRIANSSKKVSEEIMQILHSVKFINAGTIQLEIRRNKLYKNIAHALNEMFGKEIQGYMNVEEFAAGTTNEAQLSRASTMIDAITTREFVREQPVELQ